MEMGGDRVLEEVDEEVAAQDQERRVPGQLERFGQHAQERRRQHEAGAKRDEVLEQELVPASSRDDHESAQDVGEGGSETRDEADQEGLVHSRMDRGA